MVGRSAHLHRLPGQGPDPSDVLADVLLITLHYEQAREPRLAEATQGKRSSPGDEIDPLGRGLDVVKPGSGGASLLPVHAMIGAL